MQTPFIWSFLKAQKILPAEGLPLPPRTRGETSADPPSPLIPCSGITLIQRETPANSSFLPASSSALDYRPWSTKIKFGPAWHRCPSRTIFRAKCRNVFEKGVKKWSRCRALKALGGFLPRIEAQKAGFVHFFQFSGVQRVLPSGPEIP